MNKQNKTNSVGNFSRENEPRSRHFQGKTGLNLAPFEENRRKEKRKREKRKMKKRNTKKKIEIKEKKMKQRNCFYSCHQHHQLTFHSFVCLFSLTFFIFKTLKKQRERKRLLNLEKKKTPKLV